MMPVKTKAPCSTHAESDSQPAPGNAHYQVPQTIARGKVSFPMTFKTKLQRVAKTAQLTDSNEKKKVQVRRFGCQWLHAASTITIQAAGPRNQYLEGK